MNEINLLKLSALCKLVVIGTIIHFVWSLSHVHGAIFVAAYGVSEAVDWYLLRQRSNQEQEAVKRFIDTYSKSLGGGNA